MSVIPCLLSWRERRPAGRCDREQRVWLLPEQVDRGDPMAMAVEVSGLVSEQISEVYLRVLDTEWRASETLKKGVFAQVAA